MSGQHIGLAISVFLACAVEAVEALTIVLVVGYTRSWRSTFTGVAAALAVLAVITAALGPALTALPLNALCVAVGGLLLVFGMQWLRKARSTASARPRAAPECLPAVSTDTRFPAARRTFGRG